MIIRLMAILLVAIFAFLAIRSILKLPISFPNTTGCKSPTSSGTVVKSK